MGVVIVFKKVFSLLFIFSVVISCCGIIYADSTPPTNTKIKLENVQSNSLVLNLPIGPNDMPYTGLSVTLWSWLDNSTQWWETCYYATIGGIPTYTVPLYSYSTLMLNDYHTQSDHYCTIFTAANNSYQDITIYWNYLSTGLYQMYLYSHNRFLGSPNAAPNEQCMWVSCPSGTTDYERWFVNPA